MEIEFKMVNNSEELRIVEVYMIVVVIKYIVVFLIEFKEFNFINVLELCKGEFFSILL